MKTEKEVREQIKIELRILADYEARLCDGKIDVATYQFLAAKNMAIVETLKWVVGESLWDFKERG